MRPIKFRAWHKLRKQIYSVSGLSYNSPDGNLSHISVQWPASVDPRAIECFSLFEVELMQFTGLLDKNGREIYEGDILKMENATANVTFFELPPAFGLGFYHNKDKWCEDWNLCDDHNRMEVIGNIYEHPDLLKG